MVMKSLVKYIFIMLCFLASCQRAEMEDTSSDVPKDEASLGKATISFSVNLPAPEVPTKAMGDAPYTDIRNLYLIVFDENGYFVEACEAELIGENDVTHGEHLNERSYNVTLTLTDQKRIIHIIANCPTDQIRYGNEYEVISSMYVTKGQGIETSYWNRIQVPYILLKDDGIHLKDEITSKFTCIPLLRNYTQITVVPGSQLNNFELEAFAVYNTINVGTVAPYNKSNQTFQLFYDNDGLYTYDKLLEYGYEGHALARATLDNTLTDSDFIAPNQPFYMYERKISVHSSEEEKWDESPAHIIIKGKYNNSQTSTYYKIDLVRRIGTGTDVSNQYYNLLRNFKYVFTLNEVTGPGYSELDDAMEKPAGNNLSGATDTQGFTNLSDGLGRLFVSFADTTLVTSDNIKLKYKYIPQLQNADVIANDRVSITPAITDESGAVIKSLVNTTGPDSDGWTTFEFSIQPIGAIEKKQEINLHVSDNPNLHKTVRFSLLRPYAMEVKCDPKKISAGVGKEISLKIGIPDDLTENLFPLDFMIEVDKLSLGPDTEKGSILSVEGGKSIIPGQAEKQAFHYHFSLEYDSYKNPALPVVNGQKMINIDWLTNTVNSAARVYVVNKYFNTGSDNFINVDKAFKDLVVNPGNIFYGTGETASISFNLDDKENADDAAYTSKNITVTLNGLEDADGNSTLTVHPTAGEKTITIGNLHTTTLDGNVSFSVSEDEYADAASSENTRHQGQFKDLIITPDPIFYGAGQEATISLTMDDLDAKYNSRTVTVKLNGLTKNGASEFTVTPGGKVVEITGLLTTTTALPVSFTVEEPCYAPQTSAEVTRERYRFNGLTISRDPIIMGTGQTVSVSFSKDPKDTRFSSRELTIELEGLKTEEGVSEITITNPTDNITLEGLLTTTESDAVRVTVKANSSDYEPAVATAARDWYNFSNLSINNGNAVQEGIGRTVAIRFTMDNQDTGYNTTPVTIKLNGMARGGQTEFTYTPGDREVVISDIVTTSRNGNLSFTVEKSSYNTGSAEVGRRKGRFTINNTGFSENNLGIDANEPVTFNFSLSDYEEGMTVYVDLENLVPADGSLTGPVTRAFSTYEYKPSGPDCSINLKTATAEAKTCSVKLSAENYENSEVKTIEQKSPYVEIYNVTVTFTVQVKDKPVNEKTVSENLTISSTDGVEIISEVKGCDYSQIGNGNKAQHTYTTTISKLTVTTNGNDNPNLTFSCSFRNGSELRTYSATVSLNNLRNNPNITLQQQAQRP